MTCKHRYEPTNFGIKYRNPKDYWWCCARCGHTIFAAARSDK